MADDWKPGDLALCVKRGRWTEDGDGPQSGAVNLVLGVDRGPCGRIYLKLEGWPDCDRYSAVRFRKIKPLTDEEREQALQELKEPTHVVS
jgi:hypothetical protein